MPFLKLLKVTLLVQCHSVGLQVCIRYRLCELQVSIGISLNLTCTKNALMLLEMDSFKELISKPCFSTDASTCLDLNLQEEGTRTVVIHDCFAHVLARLL